MSRSWEQTRTLLNWDCVSRVSQQHQTGVSKVCLDHGNPSAADKDPAEVGGAVSGKTVG